MSRKRTRKSGTPETEAGLRRAKRRAARGGGAAGRTGDGAPAGERSLIRAVGDVAFQWRSWTPLPVIALFLWLLWDRRGAPGPGGAELSGALDLAGVALAFLGQALRFWTIGVVRAGSSGQDRRLIAARLNRNGPYALVRNPLYVGNLGIVLGLLLIANHAIGYVLGLGFFFGSYFFVIRAEEAFLREKFGAEYDEFCSQVNRWVPWLPRASLRYNPMDWGRALKKEINPFSAWALAAGVLIAGERQLERPLDRQELTAFAVTMGLVLVSLLAVKAVKLGLLGPPRPQL